MKALTVRQPWAWAIVHGEQTVETRSWPTNHRGPLLIHAGLGLDAEGLDEYELEASNLVHGAIIGSVTVVDCVKYGPQDYVWELENPVVFDEPIPCKGKLGIWNAPSW